MFKSRDGLSMVFLALAVVPALACRGPQAGQSRDTAAEQAAAEAPQGAAEAPAKGEAPAAAEAESSPAPAPPTSGPVSRPSPRSSRPPAPTEQAPAPEPPAPMPRPAEPPSPMPRSEPPPPAPPEPQIVEVTVPAGTVLELELLTALDSSVSRAGDEIQARTLTPVYVGGEPVLPRGTYVEGRVTEVESAGRVKGRARLGFTIDRLSTRTGLKKIQTSYVDKQAESTRGKDAKVIGGGAGLGAIVGGIIGGKKGAAIGAAIGGAGGTGVVLATKGEEIRLPVGTEVNVRLDEPVVVQFN